ncbi:MAG: beta-ketoacyl synthase chain length factor [Rudaea sp.]
MNARILEFTIEGIGLCAPGLPDWDSARAPLRGERALGAADMQRPSPALLSPNERRRAPDSVLLALAVAEQACAMAGRDPRTLPNVFASAYGDLAINDYLCAELARAPLDLSPTKFHNSVHNAPAGYWTIATGCMASSSAVSAGAATFGAGLLEAVLIANREAAQTLLVVFDTTTKGPLSEVVHARAAFAMAFVISPKASPGGYVVRLGLEVGVPELAPLPESLHDLQTTSPAAASLPLLAALARREPAAVDVAAGPEGTCRLHLEISF